MLYNSSCSAWALAGLPVEYQVRTLITWAFPRVIGRSRCVPQARLYFFCCPGVQDGYWHLYSWICRGLSSGRQPGGDIILELTPWRWSSHVEHIRVVNTGGWYQRTEFVEFG